MTHVIAHFIHSLYASVFQSIGPFDLSGFQVNKFASAFFGPHFFCDAHGSCVAGEEEDLLSFAQVHEEPQGFPLSFFIETNENIVQDHR